MIPANSSGGALTVIGKGEAEKPEPGLFEPRARATVRYADPAAWITAAAVARAVGPVKDSLASVRDHVGVIVASNEGPSETMAVVADAAVNGFSSPLRYPAANPGSLAGVTCIVFGFRGPTLNFILPPARAVLPGLHLAREWLLRRSVHYVVLAVCGRRASAGLLGRCLLVSTEDSSPVAGVRLREKDTVWLSTILD
jgi:hypothetical protein